MSRDILLDTSVIIAHLRGRTDIRRHVPENALLFTSLFTVGELEKGINRAARTGRERAKVEAFMNSIAVLMPDTATASTYGRTAALLEQAGERIPENDIWIAAIALECDMALATSDDHFSRVPRLHLLKCSW